VRFKVYEPQPLAAVKHWRWELEGDAEGEVLARSPWLTSREECFATCNRIRTAFANGQVEAVEVPGYDGRVDVVDAARPRSV
jgi:hypothetical protein